MSRQILHQRLAAMPPLYKRYIPPKANVTADQTQSVEAPTSTQVARANEDIAPKKRKRDRTDEEIAERKAKKLRRKGIDDGPAPIQDDEKHGSPVASESLDKTAIKSIDEPQSGFAHIKDTRKRHKLEKEARKARIAAEKAEKEIATTTVKIVERSKTRVRSRSPEQPPSIDGDGIQKRKRRRKDAVVEQEIVHDDATPRAVPADQLKKGKKTSIRKDRDESNGIAGLPEDDQTTLQLQSEEAKCQPKKRRHKLEGVLKEAIDDSTRREDDDDSHLKKHGSILKKYQKSAERSQLVPKTASKEKDPNQPEPVLLDLAPLPQPEPAVIEKFVPDDSALPAWLAKPTFISGDAREPFESLGLGVKTTTHLSKLGFHNVLPVQQAIVPILLPPGSQGAQFLPGTESVLPDIAVGAPTGSGKTIAYLLPIIESIKLSARVGDSRLRALIVVPTRELVMQVAAVAESLAKGSSVRIGMATGSGAFKDEQAKLIKRDRKYDREAYRALIAKADRRNYPPLDEDSDEFAQYLDELENDDEKMEQQIQDTVKGLVDHIPRYSSAVDILVATPGRLLDHLKSTLGFSLSHLEFLILDEADKLLDLQYDGFLETVNTELERPRHEDEQDVRERLLRREGMWDERRERRVRKVVLSATMTRDISKLVALKLSRPRMILVRGMEGQRDDAEAGVAKQDGGSFELPSKLREYCVPVGNGSEKPLFLTELLRTKILDAAGRTPPFSTTNDNPPEETDDSNDSSPDSDPPSGSDSSSDFDSGSSSSSNDDDVTHAPADPEPAIHPSRAAMLQSASAPTILVFTSSNEAASRLTHFLKSLLTPSIDTANIHTLTRQSTKSKITTSPTEPVIVVSTDRAGRGLDAIGTRHISHVIQYDVPRSLTAHVHRVGRTARAGREGEAWTLYGHSEARWFFKEVAGDVKGVKRTGVVEKVKISVEDEGMRERLAEVVEEVRRKVFERR